MHAGKVPCAQSSLGKVNVDRHTSKTPRSCYAVIRKSLKGPLGLTHGFVEQGRAIHAGKALRAKQSG